MIKPLTADEFTEGLIAPVFEEIAGKVPIEAAPDRLDLPHVVKYWTQLMRLGIARTWAGFVGGKMVGILGGLFLTEFFTGQPMAMEQFWFVLEEHRNSGIAVKLLKVFEREAIRRGARTVWAGSNRFHAPERLAGMYKRLGYQWWGATFRKLM